MNEKEEISVAELKEKAIEKMELDVPSNDAEPEKRAEMCGAGEQAKPNKDRMVDLRMDEESERESGKQQGHKHSKVARVDIKPPEVCNHWERSGKRLPGDSNFGLASEKWVLTYLLSFQLHIVLALHQRWQDLPPCL